jgi:hypothetical protein
MFGRIEAVVRGSLILTDCTSDAIAETARTTTCTMHGVVTAPGLAPLAVRCSVSAPSDRWPETGQTLPVLVDPGKPDRLKVLWDEIPTRRQVSMDRAEGLAASMRAAPQAL